MGGLTLWKVHQIQCLPLQAKGIVVVVREGDRLPGEILLQLPDIAKRIPMGAMPSSRSDSSACCTSGLARFSCSSREARNRSYCPCPSR